jgi:D-cysteine desulfhydrase family pyridoxal phosphate-dependent enzyme
MRPVIIDAVERLEVILSIGSQPRFRLAALPTPVQELKNLRAALGGPQHCPRILMKRDDLTGLAFGGNKARKLEFLVGDALRQGATALITSGAAQSNHCRMTAAAARAAGMKAALILTKNEPHPTVQGNLFLDKLLGAEIHWIDENPNPMLAVGEEEAAKFAEVTADLERRGERPYVIPIGGSSPVGALGYVTGTLELVTQLFQNGESPSRLYFANGSRGTQAGLVLGAKMYSASYRPFGIAVSGGGQEKIARAIRIATGAAELLGVPSRITEQDLINDEGYVGPGYGIVTPGCLEAVRTLACAEGILIDTTYTGKAMAGMIDHIRRGEVDPSDTVVFLHTGGAPALFAHVGDFGLE